MPMSCAVCGSGKRGAVVGSGPAQPEDVEHPQDTQLHQHISASGEEGSAASCIASGEGAAQSCPQAQPALVTTMALITHWHREGLSLIPHSDTGDTLDVCLNTLSGQ